MQNERDDQETGTAQVKGEAQDRAKGPQRRRSAPVRGLHRRADPPIRTGPGRGFEAAGEAAAGDWLLALPAKDGWSEVAAVAGGAFIRGYVPEGSFSKHGKPASRTRAYTAACRAAGTEVKAGPGHTYGSDGTLDEGAPVIAMPRRAGWCPVATFLGGRFVTGFVPAAAIKGR